MGHFISVQAPGNISFEGTRSKSNPANTYVDKDTERGRQRQREEGNMLACLHRGPMLRLAHSEKQSGRDAGKIGWRMGRKGNVLGWKG